MKDLLQWINFVYISANYANFLLPPKRGALLINQFLIQL